MRERGYELADELHNAIEGAKGWAEELCPGHEKVHWCSSAFKDSVQLRERLKRVAHNTARPLMRSPMTARSCTGSSNRYRAVPLRWNRFFK